MRHLLLALSIFLVPAPLAAQTPQASLAAQAPPPPLVRVDFGGPSLGIGLTSASGSSTLVAVGGHATVVHRSGHGARVDFVATESLAGGLLGPTPAHTETWMIDVSYAYRLRLVGTDRVGLGLDVMGGISGGQTWFHQASGGFCFDGCSPTPTVSEDVADGAQVGPNAGLSLELHAHGFSMGIDARYRALLGLQAQPGDRIDSHLFTATFFLGFGFY